MDPQLQLFYRQYMQQFSALSYPPGHLLKQHDVQYTLETNFFTDSNLHNIPPSIQTKTLDRIIQLIEAAVKNPEDEGVSDFLYQRRADLTLLKKSNDLVHSVDLVKSHLVYHAPTDLHANSTPIVINEAKNIIGAGPNVGLRTWEASLRLAHYLHENSDLVRDRTVLELGAGTGFLSIFCSTILNAKRVIVTDGIEQVLDGVRENVGLNESLLSDSGGDLTVAKLAWEDAEEDLEAALQQTPTSSSASLSQTSATPDLILGADITYHPEALDPLVSLLSRLLKEPPQPETPPQPPPTILISTTIRSPTTFSSFHHICADHGLNVAEVPFTPPGIHEQKGLFHVVAMEIKILEIKRAEIAKE